MSKTTILEVYKDKKGLYRFRLLAKNGEPVCASEAYAKKTGAMAAAKKLTEWITTSTLVDADKKADAASKTTGKSLSKKVTKQAEASGVSKKTTAQAVVK